MATTIRTLNELCDRLGNDDHPGLYGLIRAEFRTLPQQRKDAAGKADLLAAIERRETDLKMADKLRHEAVAAWRLAVAAHDSNPEECDRQYALSYRLTADAEAIVNFRKGGKKDPVKDTKVDDSAPKPDSDKEKGKKTDKPAPSDDSEAAEAKEKKADDGKAKGDPADNSDKEKTDGKAKGDKPEPKTDPVLAAITKLGEDCRSGNAELRKEIGAVSDRLTELAKGTLPDELAQILRGLDPEVARILTSLTADQLNAIINRRELTVLGADLMNVLAAYTPEELRTMLANLAAVSSKAEKVRGVLPGGKHK